MNHNSVLGIRTRALLGALVLSLSTVACDEADLVTDDSADTADVSADSEYAMTPDATWATHVVVRLTRNAAGGSAIAFGLPVPPNVKVASASQLKISLVGG